VRICETNVLQNHRKTEEALEPDEIVENRNNC